MKSVPWRGLSRLWGHLHSEYSLPVWARAPAYRLWSWAFHCDLSEIDAADLREYRNLNEFFTRRLRDGVLTREEAPPTRDLTRLDQAWQFAQAGGAHALRLQDGVQAMQLRVWTDDGRGWRGWEQMAAGIVSRGALMNPRAGTTAMQTDWRGLEVSLQMAGRERPLTKVFMLGAT